ncbi:hypothetical protein GCM10010341_87520 [Streptomyces noursei]|nr:hypothetical protein GCM10010341_87520 [Streptomyces noursei]
MGHGLASLVIRHTHRLPAPTGPAGDGAVVARQLDAALMSVGFKLSAELLAHLSELSEGTVVDTAAHTLRAVRTRLGDHVEHNVYFRDFPAHVPATLDFWMRCIAEALADDTARADTLAQLRSGVLDLLTLPSYGNYQHTYAEMLAAHDELIAAAGDRMTVLHLGGSLADETTAAYLALAGSSTPLGDDDRNEAPVLTHVRAGADVPRVSAPPSPSGRRRLFECLIDQGQRLSRLCVAIVHGGATWRRFIAMKGHRTRRRQTLEMVG